MKKSLIWMLMAIMALTFGTLLYFQIIYLENMVKMREAQFSENVMRSLHSAVGLLERYETLHYLEEDVAILNSSGEDEDSLSFSQNRVEIAAPSASYTESQNLNPFSNYRNATQEVSERYRKMRESLKNQYQYQQGLLNEVILTILRDAPLRPLEERADSTVIRNFLSTELENNGVTLPFTFAVAGKNNTLLYFTHGFIDPTEEDVPVYSTTLFPNSGSNNYRIFVEFPTRDTYIFSSVRFIIPTLAFTAILLIIFIYTIVMIFHQKKLSEMKTDFINNMTHEFKTPISTISLAAQMLGDDAVGKSPAMLKQLSGVISDESKRLRFQVEKVLQMSMYDDAGGSALKFTEVNVNSIIYNVVNTHKLKAEKDGGSIEMHLDAENAEVYIDEMHFTNVIFNLLDNAIKYMKPDTPPHLVVTTKDYGDNMIEIRIRDNGIGIKKDDLKRIFEKFYRVSTGNRHDVKGFGLGLAYVKKMVTIFKGTITAESEYGKWSEFIIRLPLVEPSAHDA